LSTEWQQLLLDWEKADRDASALDHHLRICGFQPADRKLLAAIMQEGQWVREGNAVRSELHATQRQAARMSGLSPAAVAKAAHRLASEPPATRVLLYDARQGVFVASWSRIWGRQPLAAPSFADLPTPSEGAESGVSARERSRPYQERKIYIHPPNPRNQEPRTNGSAQPMRNVLAELFDDSGEAAGRLHAQLLDRHARAIHERVRRVEERHRVEPDDRLQPSMARRIAIGISEDPESDVADDLEAVLGSLETREQFTGSPAAYLVGCAKRRGWIGGNA